MSARILYLLIKRYYFVSGKFVTEKLLFLNLETNLLNKFSMNVIKNKIKNAVFVYKIYKLYMKIINPPSAIWVFFNTSEILFLFLLKLEFFIK